MVRNRGAVRIFEKDSGEYIDGVGIEEAGHRVIVLPWRTNWCFRVSGTVGVGYIEEK
jgi:hypothetical protein